MTIKADFFSNNRLETDESLGTTVAPQAGAMGYYNELVALKNEQFAHIFLAGDNKSVYIDYTQNGAVTKQVGPVNTDTTTEEIHNLSGCSVNNEELILLFNQNPSGGSKKDLHLIYIDANGGVKETELLISQGSDLQDAFTGRCAQLSNNKVGIVFMQNDPTTSFDVYFRSYDISSKVLSSIEMVNSFTTGFQTFPDIVKISDEKAVIVQRGPGNGVAGNEFGIYYNYVDIASDGSVALKTQNYLVVGSVSTDNSGNNLAYVEKTFDNGFVIVYEKRQSNSVWMASYGSDGLQKCNLEVGSGQKWPTIATYEDLAYIAVSESGNPGADLSQSALGHVYSVQISNCIKTGEETQISNSEVNFYQQIVVNDVGSNIDFIGIQTPSKLGSANIQLTYNEFLLKQKSPICSNSNCEGCYGSKLGTCRVCAGSTVAKSAARKTVNSSCACQVTQFQNSEKDCEDCPAISYNDRQGVCQACYSKCKTCDDGTSCSSCHDPKENLELNCICPDIYYLDTNGVCQACLRQCETCSNSYTCDACIDKEFSLESNCLEKIDGNFTEIDNSGNVIVKECDTKCLTCENSADNCTSCGGLNRDTDDNCNCLAGHHDYENEAQDCEPCPLLCDTCKNSNQCYSCKKEYNRELDPFTGECKCKVGTKSHGKDLECFACYMLSDGCVHSCPENMVQNEKLMLCENVNLELSSNTATIILFGIVIAMVQAGLCILVQYRMRKHYQVFQQQFQTEQMKLVQQRNHIYQDLEKFQYSQRDNSQINTHVVSNSEKKSVTQSMVSQQQRKRRKQLVQQPSQDLSSNQDLSHSQANLMQNNGSSQKQGRRSGRTSHRNSNRNLDSSILDQEVQPID